jgi:hypothetical protein
MTVDGTKLHKFPEELGPYKGLIYVPLDLETPVVDESEFLRWFEETHDKDYLSNESDGVRLRGEYSKSLLPAQNNKNEYPWNIVYLHRHSASLKNLNVAQLPESDNYKSCLERFPSIKNYIDNLPFDRNSSIAILRQQPGLDVGIHSDYDLWFGIRFYLINKSNARIFFQKAKNPTSQRLTAFTDDNKRIPWSELVNDEKIYARYPTPTCSFHISCTHAVHGVEAVPEDIGCSRITFFFTGKLNTLKYKELLDRSLAKYGEYAIWH